MVDLGFNKRDSVYKSPKTLIGIAQGAKRALLKSNQLLSRFDFAKSYVTYLDFARFKKAEIMK